MRVFRVVCGPLVGLGVLVLLTLAAGCNSGPTKGEVQGKITFKDKAVPEGTVTFLNPKEGGAAEAPINPDGSYEVKGGVVVGDYVVEVKPPMVMMDTDPGKSPPAPVEKKAPLIPQKYRQQGTTPLKVTVKAGKNQIDFDLSK